MSAKAPGVRITAWTIRSQSLHRPWEDGGTQPQLEASYSPGVPMRLGHPSLWLSFWAGDTEEARLWEPRPAGGIWLTAQLVPRQGGVLLLAALQCAARHARPALRGPSTPDHGCLRALLRLCLCLHLRRAALPAPPRLLQAHHSLRCCLLGHASHR